jgi:hypothetical protein
MNLVSVIVGLIALALASFATFGKPAAGVATLGETAVGIAALGALLACVQFLRPSRKTGLVIAGLVCAVAAGGMVFWQKHAAEAKKTTDIPTKRILKIHNAYYHYDEDQDSGWFSTEIENISDKTISSFEGRITLVAKKGEIVHEESLSYVDPLEAGKKIFVFTQYLNIRTGQKGHTFMEPSFEKMCDWGFGLDAIPIELQDARRADIKMKMAKARHTGKVKFVCTYLKTE